MAFRKFQGLEASCAIWLDPKTVIALVRYETSNPPYTAVEVCSGNTFRHYTVVETPEDILAPGPE